eukprot:CAMPEP_0173240756 /NCGR_PEP_ID=MMETSP1142-20121109/13967_1 /TAXON_ID=483371 /ORGANISM="non described non described, Strain CCMP2298" /LENGTH=261 /DNA_ID=CAMNT_0014171961 /DNA_START=73 /DNA_END=854 /DNA_ORIENTATION=-
MIGYIAYLGHAFEHVRMPLSTVGASGEIDPVFVAATVAYAAVFATLHLSFTSIMRAVCPVWYKSLPPKKKAELPSYAIGLVHHWALSPYCLWRLVADYGMYQHGVAFPSNHYDTLFCNYGLYPLTMGFFLVDTLFYAVPEAAKGAPLYLLHHFVALSTHYSALSRVRGVLMMMFPVMMCTEISSLFFNTAWIMRAGGLRNTLVTTLEALFALSFLFIRILYVSTVMWVFWPHMGHFGYYRVGLALGLGMQYYWLYKIAASL